MFFYIFFLFISKLSFKLRRIYFEKDLKMLKKAGLSFAPQNAHELVKDSVNVVCKKSGGSGAAREMIEYILKEENLEEEFLNLWL